MLKTTALPHSFKTILSLSGLVLLLAFVALCADPGQAGAEETRTRKKILVGGDYYYPPYEFLDEDGVPAGFNVELTQAIGELMGIQMEIRLGLWSDMRKALVEGKIDALQGIIYSKERAREFDFSPPHSVIHQSIFARKDSPPIHSLDDLKGREIIVQENGIMHDFLRNGQYKLFTKQTHAQALRLLASGKHDYAVVANLPGLYLSQKLGLSNIVRVAEPLMAGPYGYAVKKGNQELLALFTEGLAVLKNTGRYQKIKNKWLSPLESDTVPWIRIFKYASIVIVPLLLTLIGIAVWNKALQKKITLATAHLQNEIAERKKAAEESASKQQQLIQADKMATIGILVSGVAHEINNPTGLLLFNLPVFKKIFQIVQDKLDLEYEETGDFKVGGMRYSILRKQVPSMLNEMEDSAQRIKRIVSDLKGFARMETAEIDAQINLNDVVEAAVRLLRNTIKKSTDHFFLHCAAGLPLVNGNAQRLEQVVVNLLLNACQALTDMNQKISVRTLFDPENNEVLVQIEDEGVGIAESCLGHIVDPFFTTKREQGGTGLGLSVSSGIVEEHGGRLEFQSSVPKGTRATLYLPVSDKETAS